LFVCFSQSDGAPGAGPCNEAVFHVPYDKAGIIIGKGGETIKEINRKSGAFVELDKNYVSPLGTPPERVFKLRGTPEQIVTAQQLMYERVANSACGASDLLTPILFQTQFNLPLVGNTPMDGGWNASSGTDPSAAGAASSTDPYSQWAAAYAQWPQVAAGANGANPADPSAAMMDPAWLAYYQSMNYYSMMQSNMSSTNSTTSTTTTKPTDSTADSTATAPATTNATPNTTTATAVAAAASGQPDYTQQWIEYYRSVGQNEYADQIAQQVKDGSASAWAAYAQQWSNGAASTATAASGSTSTSNGNSTSS
jgi:far upstream element-binding protein